MSLSFMVIVLDIFYRNYSIVVVVAALNMNVKQLQMSCKKCPVQTCCCDCIVLAAFYVSRAY